MWRALRDRGVSIDYLEHLVNTRAKDKNAYARGLFGYDRYKELRLKDFDLNLLTNDSKL